MKYVLFLAIFLVPSIYASQNKMLAQAIQHNIADNRKEVIDLVTKLAEKIFATQPNQAQEVLNILKEYVTLDYKALDAKPKENQALQLKVDSIEQQVAALKKEPHYSILFGDQDDLLEKLKAENKDPIISVNLEKALDTRNKINDLYNQMYKAMQATPKENTLTKYDDLNKKWNNMQREILANIGPADFWKNFGVELIDNILKKLRAS